MHLRLSFMMFSFSEGIHTVLRVGVLRHSGETWVRVHVRGGTLHISGTILLHQDPGLPGSYWRLGGRVGGTFL